MQQTNTTVWGALAHLEYSDFTESHVRKECGVNINNTSVLVFLLKSSTHMIVTSLTAVVGLALLCKCCCLCIKYFAPF